MRIGGEERKRNKVTSRGGARAPSKAADDAVRLPFNLRLLRVGELDGNLQLGGRVGVGIPGDHLLVCWWFLVRVCCTTNNVDRRTQEKERLCLYLERVVGLWLYVDLLKRETQQRNTLCNRRVGVLLRNLVRINV